MDKSVRSRRGIVPFFKKYGFNMALVIPLIVFIFSFTIIPIIQTIITSFKDQITSEWTLNNYSYVMQRGIFTESVFNTLFIALLGLVLQMGLGYFMASMLRKTFIGKGVARTLVMLPMGVPTMVSGIAMLNIFGTSGYLNEILFRLNLINIPIDWTATKLRSLIVIAVADSWKVMPMVVMLFLAGLEAISREVYEAADVDGANKWRKFRYITLPQLKATVTMTVLTRLVDLFRIFELPKVLVGESTPFLGTMAYQEYSYGNTGYSAVVSTMLLLIIIVVVSLYMLVVERERKVKRVS